MYSKKTLYAVGMDEDNDPYFGSTNAARKSMGLSDAAESYRLSWFKPELLPFPQNSTGRITPPSAPDLDRAFTSGVSRTKLPRGQ